MLVIRVEFLQVLPGFHRFLGVARLQKGEANLKKLAQFGFVVRRPLLGDRQQLPPVSHGQLAVSLLGRGFSGEP